VAAEELSEVAAGLLAAEDHGPGCCRRDAEQDADTALVEAGARQLRAVKCLPQP
jgi:hypothetical protein